MRRGSTPILDFDVDIDLREAQMYLTLAQGDLVIEKTEKDMQVEENRIMCPLTQEETLKFNSVQRVQIQLRYLFEDGQSDSTDIAEITIDRILKEGVVEWRS